MLPFQCYLCHSQETTAPVCPPCQADLKKLRLARGCLQCALPHTPDLCGACISNPPHFDRTLATYEYAPPLDRLIKKFKYSNGWQLARFFAAHLPTPPKTDLIIPLPLHPTREKERGYNQARELCRQAKFRTDEQYLHRIKNTLPQANFATNKERVKNVKGAFYATLEVYGKTVLLVDDIMTTGATLNEAAHALKKAGARFVIPYLIARTPLTK